MTWTVAVLVLATLVLAGCGDDAPGEASGDAPPATTAGVSAPTGDGIGTDPDTQAALDVVEAYYDAVAERDCITLRIASTPAEQAENDAWAECVDLLLEQAGEGFSYEVADGSVDGDTASFDVAVSQDSGERTDTITLVRGGGGWLVDGSLVTAGG